MKRILQKKDATLRRENFYETEGCVFCKINQQKENYNKFINYCAPTCFDIIVSSSGSSHSLPFQVIYVHRGNECELPEDDTTVSKHVGA